MFQRLEKECSANPPPPNPKVSCMVENLKLLTLGIFEQFLQGHSYSVVGLLCFEARVVQTSPGMKKGGKEKKKTTPNTNG